MLHYGIECYNGTREIIMIYFSFTIQNPWSNKFKRLFCKNGQLTKNKFWEVECYENAVLVSLRIEISLRKDHGGLDIEVGCVGYTIGAQIYDNRHWDHKTDTWVTHETN